MTAVFFGMQILELRGLAWEHVDIGHRIFSIRQRANRLDGIGSLKSGAGRRDIPMAPSVSETLECWRDRCPTGPLNLVFPNDRGKVASYANLLWRVFPPMQIKAGIVDAEGKPKHVFRALRHSAASLLIEQQWSPKKIQVIVGHSSTTLAYDVYGDLFAKAEDDLDLIEKLEPDLMAA